MGLTLPRPTVQLIHQRRARLLPAAWQQPLFEKVWIVRSKFLGTALAWSIKSNVNILLTVQSDLSELLIKAEAGPSRWASSMFLTDQCGIWLWQPTIPDQSKCNFPKWRHMRSWPSAGGHTCSWQIPDWNPSSQVFPKKRTPWNSTGMSNVNKHTHLCWETTRPF